MRPEPCCSKMESKEQRSRLDDEDSGDATDNDNDDEDDDVDDFTGVAEGEEEETFLVCVHNVSPEIPYAILKCRVANTAKDILLQALLKVDIFILQCILAIWLQMGFLLSQFSGKKTSRAGPLCPCGGTRFRTYLGASSTCLGRRGKCSSGSGKMDNSGSLFCCRARTFESSKW